VCKSFTEKPNLSNSIVIGFSRVRERIEIKFLMREGEMRMLSRTKGVDEVGTVAVAVCVIGSEEPLPTMIQEEVE